jgi:predicted acylesterase/phospholipase RssA
MRVPVPDGPSAGRAVEEALLRLGSAVERAFLDLGHRDERFAAALVPVLSEQQGMSVDGRPIARGKVVLLSRDPLAQNLPEPLRAVPVSSAALLGGPPRAAGPPQAPRARLVPAGAARLRLDLEPLATLERPEERRLEALPPATRATLSRWGRILTDRTVGVALGGGGAWGFAHLTLIRHMHAAGVPIDMISGSSFGALVGAFYCHAGLDGLDQLLRLGREANRAVAASWLSSRALARFVDEQLGGARLEDLEVPLFPVVTDLASSTQDVVWSGTLGQGVRASGAFPGMYTPVTGGGVHWVDGGFVNNVPASVLLEEGADLIVASNIVAAPAPAPPPEPLFGGDLGRLLHELNPIQRALDLVRAGFVLMHTAGARESDLADVAYESDPVELPLHERRSLRDRILRGWIPFWDFTAGPHVAEKATAKVLIAVDQIKGRWEQLSRGAGGA